MAASAEHSSRTCNLRIRAGRGHIRAGAVGKIDEVQHLQTQKTQGAEAANALKRFAEQLDASMIYAGIDLDTAPLFSGRAGAQWRARTIAYEMHSYSLTRDHDRREWINLIDAFEHDLPLCDHRPGALAELHTYLYYRTGGVIGSLKQLLTDAALDAIDDGTEQITRASLDNVSLDLQADDYAAYHPLRGSGTPRNKAAG